MKIGMVCYPTYGGSGIVATELGMELAQKGHEVHFISYSLPARLDVTMPNIYFHKVNVEPYPLFQYQPYSLALSTLMVQIARTYGLDVLHVHYAIPHAYAAYFAKQILAQDGVRLPVVTTLHGTDITLVGKHPVYQSAVEFSINQSDVITTVSDSLKEDTNQVFKITKDIKVIQNFIDNDLYKEATPCQRLNFALPEEKIIIHVSNFRRVKRIDLVIEIFNQIQKKVPAKLLMIGEGPEWEVAEKMIQEYGIGHKVRAMGKINTLPQILSLGDLFLLPSEQESFGLAALEAMAAGVPVVSSNVGGITEVNTHGETGYAYGLNQISSMVESSITLLQSETQLSQFKANAKQRALDFDKKVIMPKYLEIYQALSSS